MARFVKSTSHGFAQSRLATALVLALAIQGSAVASAAQGPDATSWVTTHTHARSPLNAKFDGYAANNEPLSIAVALKIQNKDVLDSFVNELYRPGSPAYHQFLGSQDSTAIFAPSQQQAQAVADHLIQSGFTNVQIAPNRMLVTADGTVAAARKAFRTEIAHFAVHGRDAIANTLDAQVPATLSGQVDRVLGLQTLIRPHSASLPPSELRPAYTVQSSGAHGYNPPEFATVYHAGTTAKGTSTNVAIVGWGSMTNAVADLKKMESAQGITAVPTTIKGYGGPTTNATGNDDSGQGEWALDVQSIVGISGGVKGLTLYSGYTNDTVSGGQITAQTGGGESEIAAAVNGAVSDNTAKVVNMSWSWGRGEVCNVPYNNQTVALGDDQNGGAFLDSYFELGVAQGQTFAAATGDNGAYPCPTQAQLAAEEKGVSGSLANGAYGDKTKPLANYPASSPYVVAVGGTTLNTTSADSYTSESAWPYSGGGISALETLPAWQSSLGGKYRQIPDLAFDADWTNSPVIVYFTASTTSGISQSGYYLNGGTSLASPLFVGSWARLESANSNSLGFAAPAIYAYAKSFPFHDVTSGSNGGYSAGTGRDNATGWGSFDIQAVNSFIAGNPGFVTATKNP